MTLSRLSSVPTCSVLLVASGLSVPNQVDFPGSEYAEGYETVSVDPEDFVGQNVLILGRGNSAFETAENILGVTNFIHMLSRSRVRLSWATHYVGDLRYAAFPTCISHTLHQCVLRYCDEIPEAGLFRKKKASFRS